ncbi:MAG: hypothetical protein J6P29_04420 [Acetobacter sp.]|nr:hypothetical protein [Acetobacter sp.]
METRCVEALVYNKWYMRLIVDCNLEGLQESQQTILNTCLEERFTRIQPGSRFTEHSVRFGVIGVACEKWLS